MTTPGFFTVPHRAGAERRLPAQTGGASERHRPTLRTDLPTEAQNGNGAAKHAKQDPARQEARLSCKFGGHYAQPRYEHPGDRRCVMGRELRALRASLRSSTHSPDQAESARGWTEGNGTYPWPPPLALQTELPPVQPFDEDLVPHSFRSLVVDVAERMQVPIDIPASMMVLCLAGCVNRRATIQPKALDPGWVVTPNLWGAVIAPPGFMKSPVIQAITRPLHVIPVGVAQAA